MKLHGGLIRSILAGAGAALLAVCSLATNLQLFDNWVELSLAFVGSDHVTKFEEQLEPVKALLPRQGKAGYITDSPGSVEAYYKSQYSLAPLLLEPGTTHEFVLKYQHFNSDGSGPKGEERYTVEDLGYGTRLFDFGNGIKVYRNENR
ncbi:MAG TPA: hypothetical protein VFQ92_08895 [Blastocatellia bacterium]|nr:hypothetical protein [Blastocatellia bacterium]